MNDKLRTQTIEDFGDQWTRYQDNEGYYGSVELLRDILEPLTPLESVRGQTVAEIGSGTGRIVQMLLDAGVSRITALEPSKAMDVLRANTVEKSDRIRYVQARGEQLPSDQPFDFVFSIGVLHHIPDPAPVVRAAHRALKEEGRIVIWLYGREGNGLYLAFVLPLRKLTALLPHSLLTPICHVLNAGLGAYIALARIVPVPLRGYMTEVIGNFSTSKRYLVIYDQLKPAYAKYYRRAEAESLLEEAGFVDVRSHNRHGYSWTVVGVKKAT
ncbi:MAG: class I SAM-dependent methyltransferase [Alphaproteobacteria bacterium]|nr:class I SAM-dependent methyltransferase [Alphaproteobacteria bacterium]